MPRASYLLIDEVAFIKAIGTHAEKNVRSRLGSPMERKLTLLGQYYSTCEQRDVWINDIDKRAVLDVIFEEICNIVHKKGHEVVLIEKRR